MGPELGCRTMDKLDILLIPFILLLRMSLQFFALLFPVLRLLLWLYDFCFNQAITHGLQVELLRSFLYVAYLFLRLAMLVIYWLHKILGWILAPVYYFWVVISFWPRFYWRLFRPSAKGRSVWSILTDPEDQSSVSCKLKNLNPAGWIRPLWSKYMVFSTYQVHGACAHLHQNQNKEVAESLIESAGPALPRAWDPLRLAIPFEYLSARLFKPPDCSLARLLTILPLLSLYSVPLCRGALYLSSVRVRTLLGASAKIVSSRIALTTTPRSRAGNAPVSFDSDGISFIIDNSATCIICNERSLFVGPLLPENYRVETVQATVSQKRYAGTIRLELVDDSNATHVYEIPEAIYDPQTQFNLIGIPFLAAYFNDTNCSAGDDVDADGTTIKSSGCRSKFVWDHGRNVRNFTHGESTLPELVLCQGHGYFSAFCTRSVMLMQLHSPFLLPSLSRRIVLKTLPWYRMTRIQITRILNPFPTTSRRTTLWNFTNRLLRTLPLLKHSLTKKMAPRSS